MSKQTDPIDAFYNRTAYPGDLAWQGGQPMVDPMPTPDDCLSCTALREENARLRAEVARLEGLVRDQVQDVGNMRRIAEAAKAERDRLEGLILDQSEFRCTTAIEAEAWRIRGKK